jgi:predicted small lipoprotein YifL
MTRARLGAALAVLAALTLPLAVAGCGREGPLDPPPSAAVPPPPAVASGSRVNPTTPAGGPQQRSAAQTGSAQQPQKRTFFLDPLLQ